MCFNLHRIPSVILFFPFWSFQSLRQNCRGLSQSGSSLSGALSEKERKSAGQSETFALTQAQPPQPALVVSLGFWQTWRVSYFHMDELFLNNFSNVYGRNRLSIKTRYIWCIFSFHFFPLQQIFTAVIARIIPPPLRFMFSPGLSNGRDNRNQRFVLQLCWACSLKGVGIR